MGHHMIHENTSPTHGERIMLGWLPICLAWVMIEITYARFISAKHSRDSHPYFTFGRLASSANCTSTKDGSRFFLMHEFGVRCYTS